MPAFKNEAGMIILLVLPQTGLSVIRKTVPQTTVSAKRKTVPQTTLSAKRNTVPQTIMSAKEAVIKRNISVDTLMKSIKGISAREANNILGKKGSFWQSESYDHIVRDEDELERIIKYVVMNPVKARLVESWEEWEHTYLAEEW